MINQNSLSAVYPLVDKIEAQGLVARPLAGTPLESLCNAKPYISVSDVSDAPENGEAIVSAANGICDTEEHKAAMDLVVGMAADAVQKALYNAKNVVVPTIKDLVNRYETAVAGAVSDSINNLSVQPVFYHSIWDNATILSMVERFDGVVLLQRKLTLKFPSKTSEELKDLIKTGSEKFDAEFANYLDGVSSRDRSVLLDDVYKTIFSFESMRGISNLDDIISPFKGSSDYALVTFILASKLLNNIPDGMNASLSEYQEYVSGIMEQAGRAICRTLEKREGDIKNKSLILNYPSGPYGSSYSNGIIEVNGKVYNQWLAEGGQPEALFGAYASDMERSYNALLNGKDQYLKIWDREKKINETKIRFEMQNIRINALRRAFYDTIAAMPEEEKVQVNTEITGKLEHILEYQDAKRLEDIYHVARKIVCRAIYFNSHAEDILQAIDEAAAANPGIPEQEAALLGAIDYVSKWIASMVTCVRK